MWHTAFDKNRPFGAEKTLEPSLILARERLNDTSCLNLRTWCHADANLLAADVILSCPFPSHGPFSIHLHFYCCTVLKWLFFFCLFFADSTGVCMSSNDIQITFIIKYMLVAPESERNMS